MRRAAARRALVLALATAIAAHARASAAATDEPLLPPDREVAAVLSQSPAWRAASQSIGTEQETHRQALTGPHEWVGSVGVAQRQIRDASPDNTIEWEAGLERTLRRPGKRDAADRLGGSRVELARAMRSLAWREQARALLDRYGSWLREREAARVWVEQVALLQAQADAVAKRQRLGDAARIEQVQVEAAVAQAQAQAVVAEGRAQAAREALERQFPALTFPQPVQLPDPPASPAEDAEWIDAQLAHAPELESARRELRVAEEQLRVEQLERRPDPTVGLRVGQARNANEHFVGVVFSIPFGGEYRAAAARAAGSRAAAAALLRDEAQRRAATDAGLRLREAQLAWGGWQRARLAQDKLDQAARGLARGYQLGEGSLADVLAARRLASEQQLGAAGAAVDAWLARWRLMLEAGRLWECSDFCTRP
ncbi:MAG: TolC family protein [Lautropia sp.]|nr:TolC family protein [Lautropia sp.]MCL4701653.1 TolC family protein [Burkholderiaceae bacterium]MCZ2415892.1 TolC family protein [Burkholderiales bacterium]MDL1906130.1 TolC family protein [Betaproteobacteria bacterium PRO1]MEB2335159.1 TolC family protein [Burkholderiales bacterium]